jgi:signal transduction histidine kinase
MKLLLLLGRDERFLSVATEAARLALPGASVQPVASLGAALAMPESASPELLAIVDGTVADVTQATQATGSGGLPRWAVVSAGAPLGASLAENIPRDDWEPGRLGRIFRAAMERHRLVRENVQLRGDILSIGTRITHDLRSPLGGIFATCDSLHEALVADAPGCAPLTQPILESAQDLMKLIQQVSLLAKATAIRAERQPYNMGTPVLTALERHGRLAAKKQAIIEQPDAWPEMVGDVALVEAVWWNLIDNALRHAGEQPQIELGWRRGKGEIFFSVNDRGTGVPLEKRRALFQSFHLLHEPNAPRGLGLPMVHRLVQLQGGRCGYEPGSPTGSSFFFTLPDDETTVP